MALLTPVLLYDSAYLMVNPLGTAVTDPRRPSMVYVTG